MEYYAGNGLQVYCENGLVAETDECPCGCPSFVGRTIAYVDKNVVGGLGDGTSWANAYTDLQTAINANPRKEIDIKGYGESDAYPAGITLAECVYLKGVDDMWIDGEWSGIGIDGSFISTAMVDFINIKNCERSFSECMLLNNCISKNNIRYHFVRCGLVSECSSIGLPDGFFECSNLFGCSTNGAFNGFWANTNATNCTAENSTQSGFFQPSGFLVGCTSISNGIFGFGGASATLTNCIAQNNDDCGFTSSVSSPFILIGCTDANNCLAPSSTLCGNNLCDVV